MAGGGPECGRRRSGVWPAAAGATIPAFLRVFGSWGCLITRKNAGIVAFAVLAAFSVVLRAFWGSFGLIPAAVQSVAGGGPLTTSDYFLLLLTTSSNLLVRTNSYYCLLLLPTSEYF